MREKKTGFIIGGVIAGFTAIATVFGFITDISDWSKKDTTEVAQITETTTNITELTTEQTKENIVTTSKEVTEPPATTTEEVTTEKVTTEATTIPKNPEDFYLHNIEPTESSDIHNSDSETDTIGNQYTGNVQYVVSNGYAIYYVGGKYTKLKGIIAAAANDFHNDNISTITILVDDEEVYNTGEFSRVSTPMEVDIDITGAQWIKIQHSRTYGYGETILANFKFVE